MNRFNDLPVLVLLIKIHEKKKKKRKKYRKKKRRDKSMMEHFFYHMACYRQTQLKETRVTWTLPPIIAKKWTVNRPFQFLFPSPKVRRFEDSKARKVRCLVTAVTASIQVEIEMSHVDNVKQPLHQMTIRLWLVVSRSATDSFLNVFISTTERWVQFVSSRQRLNRRFKSRDRSASLLIESSSANALLRGTGMASRDRHHVYLK